MIPLHFGRGPRRLFGAYHPPGDEDGRSTGAAGGPAGVVVCPPVGHAYFRSHRALRHLAEELSGAGHPALRFDYHGTGDSSGSHADARLDVWTRDVAAAAEELRAVAGVERVHAVGLGLGAALAALADRGGDGATVLWRPVVDGRRWVRGLREDHREFLASVHPGRSPPDPPDGDGFEALGFRAPGPLAERLRELDLADAPPPSGPVLVLAGGDRADRLAGAWRRAGADPVDVREPPGDGDWMEDEGGGRLVPRAALQEIRAWLGRSGS